MTLRERLDADLKDAMRAKDQLRLDVVRAVKSAVKYREVEGDKAVVLDETAILQVVGSAIPAGGAHAFLRQNDGTMCTRGILSTAFKGA